MARPNFARAAEEALGLEAPPRRLPPHDLVVVALIQGCVFADSALILVRPTWMIRQHPTCIEVKDNEVDSGTAPGARLSIIDDARCPRGPLRAGRYARGTRT